ncbi:hypothetical protein evm_013287 [Chilo suppressalis]|nr:hypothetical protein evm_013287 [Chilo suppressalis]
MHDDSRVLAVYILRETIPSLGVTGGVGQELPTLTNMRLLLALSLIMLQHVAPGNTRNLRPSAAAARPAASDNANQDLSDLLFPLLEHLDDHVHEVQNKRLLEITPLKKTKSKKTPLLILASEIPARKIKNKFDFTDATEYLQNNGVNKNFNVHNQNQKHTSEERVNHEITRKQKRDQDKHSIESYTDSEEDVNGQLYKLKQYSNKISNSNQLVSSNNQGQAKSQSFNDVDKHFFEDSSNSLENSDEDKQHYPNNRIFKHFLGEFVHNLSFAKNNKDTNNKVNEASDEESGYHLENEKVNVDDTSAELSEEPNKVDETREDLKKSVEKNKDSEVTKTFNLKNKDMLVDFDKKDDVNAFKNHYDVVQSHSIELSNVNPEKVEHHLFQPTESKENVHSMDVNNQNRYVIIEKKEADKRIKNDNSEDSVHVNDYSDNLYQEPSSALEHALGKVQTGDRSSESLEDLRAELSKLQSSNDPNKFMLSIKPNRDNKAILKEFNVNQQKAVDNDDALSKVLHLVNEDLSHNTYNSNSKQCATSSEGEESPVKKNSIVESVCPVNNVEGVKKGVDAVNNESFEELLEIIDNIDKNKLSHVSAGTCDHVSRVGNEDLKGVHKIYNLSFRFRK